MNMKPSLPSALAFCSALAAAAALTGGCSPNPNLVDGGTGDTDGGGGNEDGGGGPGGACPAGQSGSLSICQIQNDGAAGHPGAGDEVTVRGVVVTSPTFEIGSTGTLLGLFASDAEGGAFSGVLVTFTSDSGFAAAQGDVVDITGVVSEFNGGGVGSETRLQATTLTGTGDTATVSPTELDDPAVLADEETAEPYEGVLVTVSAVATTALLDFGQFEVTGGLITDDTIYHYAAVAGEVFTTLSGVMGYSAFEDGGPRLLPRSVDDAVSQSRPTLTIPQILDPSADGYVAGCPFCPGTTSTCSPSVVQLEGMVVVSPTYYITTSSSRGPTFGVFVADPTAVDGDGRLTPYSGILVSVAPEWSGFSAGTYAYTHVEGDDEITDAASVPALGDVVTVVGENGGFCGMPQISSVSTITRTGTVALDAMPKPALFDVAVTDANADGYPGNLKAGHPAVTTTGFESPADAADPDAAKWLGVLVELKGVQTTKACVDSFVSNPNRLQDFGYWEVTGGAELGTLFDRTFGGYWKGVEFDGARSCTDAATTGKCEDSRELNQTFTSLSGIVNFSFNVYRVNPRFTADIAPSSLFVAADTGTCPASP